MDCCLIVYQPYRPLLQMIQDIGHEDQLLSLAWRLVNDSLRTDLCLLYPPYQIAIGKFSGISKFHNISRTRAYIILFVFKVVFKSHALFNKKMD